MRARSYSLVSVAFLAATSARVASAERLFSPGGDARTAAPGIATVRSLELNRAALTMLRASEGMRITDLPLGGDIVGATTVTRFNPFPGDVQVEVVEAGGVRKLALPDQLYFRGRVDGDPASLVVMAVTADTVRGLVASNGTVYRFGPAAGGRHYSWALRDADPSMFRPPAPCSSDTLPLPHADAGARRGAIDASLIARDAAFSPTLLAEVAIDTDEEFLAKFQTPNGALAYLAELAMTVSAIYEAEVGVRIVFRYIRLWGTTDPWEAPHATSMVYEVSRHWATEETDIARDVMHFISGKSPGGGAAFLGGLCNAFGYGASVVYGAFDLLSPADTWDVYVVAHELGHNFGSVHTHCYDPPLDQCNSNESGCWSGPWGIPPEGGTLMSYCGLQNITLTFGETVSAVLRSGADAALCFGPPCGDGQIDPGEECDDGNVVDGDCCSTACTAAPDGGSCDDDNVCTTTGTCTAGVCIAAPVADGAACDDGKICTSDACVAGSCVGAWGPAIDCKQSIGPSASRLLLKDRGGGSGNALRWQWKKGEQTTPADLGDPTVTDGYELCVYDAASSVLISEHMGARGTCDGSPCWRSLSNQGFEYRSSTPGIRKLLLRTGENGSARISALGKDLAMPRGLLDLALPLRVQLHGAGECWESSFSAAYTTTPNLFKAKSD